ncbi:MAG: cell division protein FtsZ [Bacteroidales bacterium]|nr:cell division protein FtsZ [Bacteroidales bacterium]
MLEFDAPKNQSSIIKVIGVGGGGSNAVNHMYEQGIKGVDFLVCNTDAQALQASPVPNKIQLGARELGAGSKPNVGKEAALESIEQIKEILQHNTKLLFITAGMGGGTGTGAAPVIAAVARELGILTVGIVTIPFAFEGRKRKLQADQGIEEMKQYVDTLLVICNDKLRELHGNLKLSEAFSEADSILMIAAKGIAEIITVVGYINVDFEDVKTVMQNSGRAIMGAAVAEGDDRALTAIQQALSSPLLDDNDIEGADDILLYIASGDEEISMDEVTLITDYIQEEAGLKAEIIWGTGVDEALGNKISITLIATGFTTETKSGLAQESEQVTKVNLYGDIKQNANLPKTNMLDVQAVNTERRETVVPEPVDISGPYLKTEATEKPEVKNINLLEITEPVLIRNEARLENSNRSSERILASQPSRVEEIEPDFGGGLERKIEETQDIRKNKLRGFSVFKSKDDLKFMEDVPAYKRREVELSENTSSKSENISRYTLGEVDDNKVELRANNSFLHKEVD